MSRPDLKGIDPTDADIRLVGLFAKPLDPILWYNFKKVNGKDADWIMDDMHKRFMAYVNKVQIVNRLHCIQYYNNRTNQLLKEYK